jgi:hypothetical protein
VKGKLIDYTGIADMHGAEKMKYIRLYFGTWNGLSSTVEEELGDTLRSDIWTSRGSEEGIIVGRDRVP